MLGLVGRKCGMTRRFTEQGEAIPVTVIQILPNRVTQIKSVERDGYQAVQVTMGERRANLLNKPQKGHFAKANVGSGEGLWEFRVTADASKENEAVQNIKVGDEIKLNIFSVGQKVDVTGTTKGCGFTGVIKRHNFATQDATHGNSLSHRAPGSIGQRQTPGRVFKGKRMAGHYGNERCTQQNLEVVAIDEERHLLLVKGAIPGAPKSIVIVKKAVKARSEIKE